MRDYHQLDLPPLQGLGWKLTDFSKGSEDLAIRFSFKATTLIATHNPVRYFYPYLLRPMFLEVGLGT